MPDPEPQIHSTQGDESPPHPAEPDARPETAGIAGSQAEIRLNTEELLKQAEQKAQESHDAWLRAKAETDNIRKRAQVELANAYKYAIETLAAELLPVKDSLEATLTADSAAIDTLRSGVDLTLKQLNAAFDKVSLKEINPAAGQRFDPHQHQAISMLPSEKEPNTVINVLQKGYSLHDRVIRPALVTVAKPKDNSA
ncbi:MAG TPA: nucleotide exchange factor GrpE [Burkholderiales bacterium]|jgi:molecular chaperone GrpE